MGEPIALEGHLCPELFSAVPHESKSVPQRLKPSSAQTITARLNPCPSFDSLFPSRSGAVQIGQPKNLMWTGCNVETEAPSPQSRRAPSYFPCPWLRASHSEGDIPTRCVKTRVRAVAFAYPTADAISLSELPLRNIVWATPRRQVVRSSNAVMPTTLRKWA